MTAFDRALRFTLQWEGGLVDHPDDPGGLTKYGISQRAYPHLDIRALTKEQAAEIYRRDYWQAARCHELPDAVAVAHFDCAVHCGVGNAARMLQRAARVADDGKIGPVTLAAVKAADPKALVAQMLVERVGHYMDIIGRNPKLATFARGWWARVSALAKEVS